MIFRNHNIYNKKNSNYHFSRKVKKSLQGSILPNDHRAYYYLFDVHHVVLMQRKKRVFWKSVVIIGDVWSSEQSREVGFTLFEDEDEKGDYILVTKMVYDKNYDMDRLKSKKAEESKTATLDYPSIDLYVKLLPKKDCLGLIRDCKRLSKAMVDGIKFKFVGKGHAREKWDAFNILVSNRTIRMETNWLTCEARCSFDVDKMVGRFERLLTLRSGVDIQEIMFSYRYDADHFEELTFKGSPSQAVGGKKG